MRGEAIGKFDRRPIMAAVAASVATVLAALVIALLQLTPSETAMSQSETAMSQSKTARAFDYALGVGPSELNDAQLATVLDKAKAAGVTSIHSGATWWELDTLDTSNRSYDWSDLDRLVKGAEVRGMKVTLQLAGTPDRVHPDLVNTVPAHSDRVWYPPRGDIELRHWSNFVHDLVSRYQGRVAHYEMWNEPNISDFYMPNPNPKEYAALLRAGYLSAKNAYPDASVMFGGLSRNDVGYLNTFYSEAKRYAAAADNRYFFDVMDVHPYSSIPAATEDGLQEPISPDVYTSDAVLDGAYGKVDQNFLGVKAIRSAMNEQEHASKQIYLGEYGFSTTDTWMKAVPDSERARYLKRAYSLARDLTYVEGMRWYAYHPTNSTGVEWSILDSNLNATMSFRALRQVTGSESRRTNVTLRTPSADAISGTYTIDPAVTDLGPTLNWNLYVDGVKQGTYDQVPFDWDTMSVADGDHTLMVAAYTKEGSVWPSNVISVKVSDSGSQ